MRKLLIALSSFVPMFIASGALAAPPARTSQTVSCVHCSANNKTKSEPVASRAALYGTNNQACSGDAIRIAVRWGARQQPCADCTKTHQSV